MYDILKTLANPFTPSYLLVVLALVGVAWRGGLSRKGQVLLALVIFVLGAGSTPAAAYLALGSLEWRYPPVDEWHTPPDAIVVLSGEVRWPSAVRREPELGVNTLYRCLKAAELYRRDGPCLVILSGGRIPDDAPQSFARVMQQFLITQGIPADDLVLEERSTTTYENAVEVAKIIEKKTQAGAFPRNDLEQHSDPAHSTGVSRPPTVMLVTDALHLRRAEACFHAQGVTVVPVGCRYQATDFQWDLRSFLPSPHATGRVAEASHEWLGRGWYWMRGEVGRWDGGTVGRWDGGTVVALWLLVPIRFPPLGWGGLGRGGRSLVLSYLFVVRSTTQHAPRTDL